MVWDQEGVPSGGGERVHPRVDRTARAELRREVTVGRRFVHRESGERRVVAEQEQVAVSDGGSAKAEPDLGGRHDDEPSAVVIMRELRREEVVVLGLDRVARAAVVVDVVGECDPIETLHRGVVEDGGESATAHAATVHVRRDAVTRDTCVGVGVARVEDVLAECFGGVGRGERRTGEEQEGVHGGRSVASRNRAAGACTTSRAPR